MKTVHLSQFKTALFLGLFLAFQSCMPVPGSWKNDQISAGKRDDFHQLNSSAITYLKANDPKGLKMVGSKEMNQQINERLVERISYWLNDNTYKLLDEYYAVHKYKDTDTIPVKSGDINRYSVLYPDKAQEMYMAYFVPEKGNNKYMLSLVFAKLSYGWKLVKFSLEPYTLNGKTAPELYALARQQYDKQEVQAALNNVSLAMTCFEPGAYWKYPDKGDAQDLYVRVNKAVNERYSYPLILHQLSTGPMILRVYNKTVDDGTYPMIYYMTHYELKDTDDVKKENLKIRAVIAKLMPGIDENNKYILYSAFNKQPTGYNTVEHFEMMVKVH